MRKVSTEGSRAKRLVHSGRLRGGPGVWKAERGGRVKNRRGVQVSNDHADSMFHRERHGQTRGRMKSFKVQGPGQGALAQI